MHKICVTIYCDRLWYATCDVKKKDFLEFLWNISNMLSILDECARMARIFSFLFPCLAFWSYIEKSWKSWNVFASLIVGDEI